MVTLFTIIGVIVVILIVLFVVVPAVYLIWHGLHAPQAREDTWFVRVNGGKQ